MTRRVKVTASNKADLRAFLANSGVDFGCRAMAWVEGDGVATIALADTDALQSLMTRTTAGRRIEPLEELPAARTRLSMVSQGNRFLAGEPVAGYGERTSG